MPGILPVEEAEPEPQPEEEQEPDPESAQPPGGELGAAVAAALQAALERTGELPPTARPEPGSGATNGSNPNEPLDLLDTSSAPWLRDPELGVQWAESWIASHPVEPEPTVLPEQPAEAAAAPEPKAADRPPEPPPTAAQPAAPPETRPPAPEAPVARSDAAPPTPPPESGSSLPPWERRPYEPRSLERLFGSDVSLPRPEVRAPRQEPEPEPEPAPRPRRKPRRPPLTQRDWAGALVAGLALGLVAGLVGYSFGPAVHDVYLTRYVVPVKELPPALEGLHVVQVSDLHLPHGAEVAASAARLVLKAKPDIVLITGDVLDDDSPAAYAALDRFLAIASGSKGTFAVAGEREAGFVGALRDAYAAHGVRLLSNERASVEVGDARLVIAGFDGPPGRTLQITPASATAGAELAAAAENLARPKVQIWMMHAPEVVADVPRSDLKDAAFIVSGHTLGGTLGLPSVLDPGQYRSGWYSLDVTQLYVSNGVGTGRIPARLFAPAEVTRFTLQRALQPYATPKRDVSPE